MNPMDSMNDDDKLRLTMAAAIILITLILGSQYSAPIGRIVSTIYHRLQWQLCMAFGWHPPPSLSAVAKIQQKQKCTKNGSKDGSSITDIVVTGIYTYPVKSLRAVSHDVANLDDKGLVGDRRYMLVTPAPVPIYGHFKKDDATHRFLTQRQCPSLARIVVTYSNNQSELSFSSDVVKDTTCTISTRADPKAPIYRSTLWGSIMTVQDMGDTIAAYLQQVVDADTELADEVKRAGVRLVAQHDSDTRTSKERFVPPVARTWYGTNPKVAFADGFPLLIASESSLSELNRRLIKKSKEPLPMSRFRPNIVIAGGDFDDLLNNDDNDDTLLQPFAEDRMKVIQIGNVVYHIISSCARCKQSCTDQVHGVVTDEPVEIMKEFRRLHPTEADGVYFAVNATTAPSSSLSSSGTNTIRVGDVVKVLQWGEPVWGDP